MKFRIARFLIMISVLHSGCNKSSVDKNDDPNKYAGVWKAVNAAQDLDGDKVIDENEKATIRGSSELRLNSNGSYTYSINSPGAAPFNMNGTWSVGSDHKTITVSDVSLGNLRFDIKSDNELHTEPISSDGKTVWLIYFR